MGVHNFTIASKDVVLWLCILILSFFKVPFDMRGSGKGQQKEVKRKSNNNKIFKNKKKLSLSPMNFTFIIAYDD